MDAGCPIHGLPGNHIPDAGKKVETIWDGGAIREFKDGKEISE
jgi:hypothetical protein